MSTDFAEKEREFLATLEADTGRTLAAWMEAISAQGFADKNEAIDWLRQQGFMFSKAAWLERIHHNGGRPIYDGAPPEAKVAAPAAPAAAIEPGAAAPPRPPVAPEPPPARAPPPLPADPALEELLSKAKALQPLARHVLRETAKAVPGVSLTAEAGSVILSHGAAFGALSISPRELRLALALDGEPFEAPLAAARLPAPAPRTARPLTHMALLTDARQVDSRLLAAIVAAAERSLA
jgi:hypothetical protein